MNTPIEGASETDWAGQCRIAAYYIYQKRVRNQEPGSALEDWLAAMNQIAGVAITAIETAADAEINSGRTSDE